MEIIDMSLGLNNSRRAPHGFTLIDVMGAVLVIGLALVGLVTANGRAMSMLKSSKQAAVASKCLQQRIEQLRSYNYSELTTSAELMSLYGVPPLPSAELPSFAEQVTVSAFTPATTSGTTSSAPVAPFIQVTRAVNGNVTLVSDNTSLVSTPEVRVDVQITWPGPGGTTRMRQTSVIVANGGIGR
jgi:Tfp pilus assembly protein PilV